jgi:hypothetical protein
MEKNKTRMRERQDGAPLAGIFTLDGIHISKITRFAASC